jgi:hypothetical protein
VATLREFFFSISSIYKHFFGIMKQTVTNILSTKLNTSSDAKQMVMARALSTPQSLNKMDVFWVGPPTTIEERPY